MARVFVVWQHKELVTARGHRLCGGGESVPANHPLLGEVVDLPSQGYFQGEDAPVVAKPQSAPSKFEKLPKDDEDVDED